MKIKGKENQYLLRALYGGLCWGFSWKLPFSILTVTLCNQYYGQFAGEEAEAWDISGKGTVGT